MALAAWDRSHASDLTRPHQPRVDGSERAVVGRNDASRFAAVGQIFTTGIAASAQDSQNMQARTKRKARHRQRCALLGVFTCRPAGGARLFG